MRLYHPELKRTHDIPDDENLFGVLAEAGWAKTVPPDHVDPALADHQPDGVYQLVPTDTEPAEPARKRRARTTTDAESAESD